MLPVLFLYSCGTRFARNCRTFRRAACRSAKPRVAATSSPFPRLLFGGLQVSSLFPMRQALSRSLSLAGFAQALRTTAPIHRGSPPLRFAPFPRHSGIVSDVSRCRQHPQRLRHCSLQTGYARLTDYNER